MTTDDAGEVARQWVGPELNLAQLAIYGPGASPRESVLVVLSVDVENHAVTVRVRDGWRVIAEDWTDEEPNL